LRGQNEATKSDKDMAERTVHRGVDLLVDADVLARLDD